MRTLLLPIFEPGSYHDRAVANKDGLRKAFEALGPTQEWDYLANDRATAFAGLANRIETFNPTLVFTQLGSTEHFSADQIALLRREYPTVRFANWNGDYWPEHLTSPAMLELLRHFDVQLVVNGAVLPDYARAGVRAAFWPFGYETPNRELPDVPAYDVVYLGNNYSPSRAELYTLLRSLPYSVGIYGSGWPRSEGECTYDFTYGEALYRKAKLTISDAQWPDADGYLSNRPFQAMAAGCFVLQQRVKDVQVMTGLVNGAHWALYFTPDELPDLVRDWLHRDAERRHIAAKGRREVQERHSWDERVRVLVDELLPELELKTEQM